MIHKVSTFIYSSTDRYVFNQAREKVKTISVLFKSIHFAISKSVTSNVKTSLQSRPLTTNEDISQLGKKDFEFAVTFQSIYALCKCACEITDFKTILIFFRTFLHSSFEEKKLIQEKKEALATTYIFLFKPDEYSSIEFRRHLASHAICGAKRASSNPSHRIHKVYSQESQKNFCFSIIHKCKLSTDFEAKFQLLSTLDMSIDPSDFNNYLTEQKLKENSDLEETQSTKVFTYLAALYDDTHYSLLVDCIEPSDPSFILHLIDASPSFLRNLPIRKKIDLLNGLNEIIFELFNDISKEDEKILLNTLCGPSGILRKLALPKRYKALRRILKNLDSLTEDQASLIYKCKKKIKSF